MVPRRGAASKPQAVGGNGIVSERPIMRHLMNVETVST
jgi:hypothetical protein